MSNEDTSLVSRNLSKTFLIYSVITISLSRFLYGYDRGAIGGASIGLLSYNLVNSNQYAVLVSLPIFASVGGCVLAGFLQSKFGRKVAICVSTLVYCIGIILVTSFKNPTFLTLLTGRIFSNIAFGMANNTSLVYVIEITPSLYRGIVLVLNTLAIPFGNSLSGLINLAISKTRGSDDWKLMLATCLVPGILQLLFLIPIPMSYTWLYKKGKLEKSRAEAAKLYHQLSNVEYKTLLEITDDSSNEQENDTSVQIINVGTVRRMTTVALALVIIGQVSGFSAVIYYSVEVAHTSGIGGGDDATLAFAVSETIFVTNFIGVLVSMTLVEKLGRRNLLILSQVGTLLSLICIIGSMVVVDSADMIVDPYVEAVSPTCAVSTCSKCVTQPECGICYFPPNTTFTSASASNKSGFCVEGNAEHSDLNKCENEGGLYCATHCHSSGTKILLASMLSFTLFFSLGLAALPVVISAEIFPYHLRDVFTSVSTSVFYTALGIVALVYGSLYPIIGMTYMYTIFAVLTLTGLIFVVFALPETKGRTPETMWELFQEPWCGGRDSYMQLNTPPNSDDNSCEE